LAYQTGIVGPLTYHQNNSGVSTDTDTDIRYTPQEFGAPAGAQIITGTVDQNYNVSRGTAYVHNLVIEANAVIFQVFTQTVDNGLFGHHSGEITVDTTFQWYTE
jgi:hypothetical protein